ncbi:MAG: NfeD family protein [Bryobacteraceae bacterium]|nr:NfeD family protein [Bryobacteraceae bacterium]
MPGWLSQISAFSVFLGIAAIGFIFLVVSLMFGEIFEHIGGFDHDFDHGGPSFLSPRVLSVFITAFGGFGAVGIHYGLSTLAASGVGFASGIGFGSLIYLFARFLYGQQASTHLQTEDMMGKTARVVVSIPAGGIGQVRCQLGEEVIDKIARSKDGAALPENTIVVVDQILGEIVVVRPY